MTPDIVVIGASLGGLKALELLLSQLPDSFPRPIVIVQHRSKDADGALSELLQRKCKAVVKEAEDKEPISPGRIYVAPPDYHLLFEEGRFCLSTEAPVRHARPSIDVTLESAAQAYGSKVIGIVLTGSNEDGAHGAALVGQRGGLVIAQDPKTAEAATMPAAAVEASGGKVMSIPEIAGFLGRLPPT